ncbi:cobalamin-dependent protein [Azospirillum halopraeferens]|uniref:cobalamin-dependent protein n=1 Tax=Azospirillum halopraeferens TaxID=34010 RepID=UPI000413A18E|nr:cobalamin-dependent protein [Azospirillum halopraeferens]
MDSASSIQARRGDLARTVVDRLYERRPDLPDRYGPFGREKCVADIGYHLLYLSEAVAADSPALFREYVAWVKVLFAGLGIPWTDLEESLRILDDVLEDTIGGETARRARACIAAALQALPGAPDDLPPLIAPDAPHADLASAYLEALLEGDRRRAATLVVDRVEAGLPVRDVYLHVFQPAMREVGRLWQTGRISVAHEHFATAATQAVMGMLYPRIFSGHRIGRTLVATCISGEQHEIGIRMVADFFEMDGWDTYYVGANTPTPAILRTVRERRADVLAVSATITGHIGAVADLVRALRAEAAAPPPYVLVGGYPFNIDSDLWHKVGADAFAGAADEAVRIAGRLVGILPPPAGEAAR